MFTFSQICYLCLNPFQDYPYIFEALLVSNSVYQEERKEPGLTGVKLVKRAKRGLEEPRRQVSKYESDTLLLSLL